MSAMQVTINGRKLLGRPGQTILELAIENGIDIPNLCYDPRLAPAGSCRLCLGEVDGQNEPVTAPLSHRREPTQSNRKDKDEH